ncbi:MAG: hypothetical protein ACLVGL_04000 [Waltera sp.]
MDRRPLGNTSLGFQCSGDTGGNSDPEMSIALAHAVEDTMCDEFAESIVEIDRIKVLDHGDFAEVVVPDVRPVRAVILAAVLSLFFAVVLFLLVEISQDSIWLPATLRRRYGLNSLGTVRSVGFAENLMYTLEKVYDKKQAKESENAEICRVAVCVALPEADPKEVVEDLQKLAKTGKIRKGIPVEYVAVPSPLLCPRVERHFVQGRCISSLAVPAGERVGKRLERY